MSCPRIHPQTHPSTHLYSFIHPFIHPPIHSSSIYLPIPYPHRWLEYYPSVAVFLMKDCADVRWRSSEVWWGRGQRTEGQGQELPSKSGRQQFRKTYQPGNGSTGHRPLHGWHRFGNDGSGIGGRGGGDGGWRCNAVVVVWLLLWNWCALLVYCWWFWLLCGGGDGGGGKVVVEVMMMVLVEWWYWLGWTSLWWLLHWSTTFGLIACGRISGLFRVQASEWIRSGYKSL